MTTKPDAEKSEAGPPAKSKKLMVVIGVVFLLLALAGGGAWFFLSKKNAADEGSEEIAHVTPKGPPTFLPLDNMVVNLADPGGEKVAQIGITLELVDAHATDKVKMYLPSIRSGILMLVSQRTAEELLLIEGKEKLAADILREASRPFGSVDVEAEADQGSTKPKKGAGKTKKKSAGKHAGDENPVRGVHFSSFIVQ